MSCQCFITESDGNSTAISNATKVATEKTQELLGDSLTTASSQDEVTNYLILAIVVTIVSVKIIGYHISY